VRGEGRQDRASRCSFGFPGLGVRKDGNRWEKNHAVSHTPFFVPPQNVQVGKKKNTESKKSTWIIAIKFSWVVLTSVKFLSTVNTLLFKLGSTAGAAGLASVGSSRKTSQS
jgi:hypothetical protein